ncbi:MAG: yfmS 10 [Firmicutes bacterium]|nr:yfmS 10 [Bacillota bacterium]
MTKLDSIIASVDIIKKACTVDSVVLVVDRSGIIVAFAAADFMPNRPEVGVARLPEEAAVYRAMERKEVVSEMREVIKSQACPIIEDDGSVSGAIIMSQSLETQKNLSAAACDLASSSEQLAATTEELGAAASKLAEELVRVKIGSESVLSNISQTDDILRFVSDVAANSNLLGLNAAIEAARAGEHGRGFAVVADEIRKMAANSAQSVDEIKKILQKIHSETTGVAGTIGSASEFSERQAAATEEIAATVQSLAATAAKVEKIAGEL